MEKLFSLLILLSLAFSVPAQDNRSVILQDLEQNQATNQNVTSSATLKSASRLFADKNDLTSVILVIPSGSEVEVLGADSTYLHVVFDENEGYILRRHAVMNEVSVASRATSQTQQNVQEAEPQQSQQQRQGVSRFTYLENKYGSNMAAKMIAGKVWKGMSAEMVRDSWGKPLKINRVITSNTIKEEWIYKSSWLYLENDVLYSWGPIKK
ncbi:MAG: hypothetical protein IQL11_04850 [Bacteroidales bacterium]|nr:hypothetical protein [Bacteroidales bacterium]